MVFMVCNEFDLRNGLFLSALWQSHFAQIQIDDDLAMFIK